MRFPELRGVIERRILANFRVEAAVLGRILPPPFRPQRVGGWGIAGICLIRLSAIRPRCLPACLGVASENAAHRIAVEWDTPDGPRHGVYIPRRDTSSRLNAAVGGWLFPGEHHLAEFTVRESAAQFHVSVRAPRGGLAVVVEGRLAAGLPSGSVFASLEEASAFFSAGSLGYSVTRRPGRFDGLELRTQTWRVEPLQVQRIESSYFADANRFPPGTVHFDCGLLMRNIEHTWCSRESLCCVPAPSAHAVNERGLAGR